MKNRILNLEYFILPFLTSTIIVITAIYWFSTELEILPACPRPITKLKIDGPGEDYLIATVVKNEKVYLAATTTRGFMLDDNVKLNSSTPYDITYVACYNTVSEDGWEWARQFPGVSIKKILATNTSLLIDATFSREVNINNSENLPRALTPLNLVPAGETDAALLSLNLNDGSLQSVIHFQNEWVESSVDLSVTNRSGDYVWVTDLSNVSKFEVAEYLPAATGEEFERRLYSINSSNFSSQSKVINSFSSTGQWDLFILNDKSNTSEVFVSSSGGEIFLGGHFYGTSNFGLEAFKPRESGSVGQLMEITETEISEADGNTFISVYKKDGNQLYLVNGLSKYFEMTGIKYDNVRSILTVSGQYNSVVSDRFYDYELVSIRPPGMKGIVLKMAGGFWIPGSIFSNLVTKEKVFDGYGDLYCKGVQTTSQGTTISTGTFDRNVLLPDNTFYRTFRGKSNIIQLPDNNTIIITGNKSYMLASYDMSPTLETIAFQSQNLGPVNLMAFPKTTGCYEETFYFRNSNNNIGLLILRN